MDAIAEMKLLVTGTDALSGNSNVPPDGSPGEHAEAYSGFPSVPEEHRAAITELGATVEANRKNMGCGPLPWALEPLSVPLPPNGEEGATGEPSGDTAPLSVPYSADALDAGSSLTSAGNDDRAIDLGNRQSDRGRVEPGDVEVAGEMPGDTVLDQPGLQDISLQEYVGESIDHDDQDVSLEPRGQSQDARKDVAAKDALVPAADEIAAIETVQFCMKAVQALSDHGTELTPEQRVEWVTGSLARLYDDASVPPPVLGDIANALYDLAPEEYGQWVEKHTKRGTLFLMGTRAYPPKLVSKILALFRPNMIDELKLRSISDVAMLDAALAAYCDYVCTTLELKFAREVRDELRNDEKAARDAKLLAMAQTSLKLYLGTMEKLQARTRTPVLNIQNARAVAVQVNAGTSCSSRSVKGR